MGPIKQTQIGSIYNSRRNICVHHSIKFETWHIVNLIIDPKGLDAKAGLGEVKIDSMVVKLRQSKIAIMIDDDTRFYRWKRKADVGEKAAVTVEKEHVDM